jgi:DNA-directed RNA polymerase subunit RPC12/RpoP
MASIGQTASSIARMDMLLDEVKRRSRVANETLDVMEGVRRCPKCGSKRLENARIKSG